MSVGHVARAAEEAGISTVGIYVTAFSHVAAEMSLPRTLITPHPFGRPIGPVGVASRHVDVINAALDLVEQATEGGSTMHMPGRFAPG